MSTDLTIRTMEGEVLDPMCAAIEAACICQLLPDHDGPHSCECGGEWHYEGKDFCADKLPGPFGMFG